MRGFLFLFLYSFLIDAATAQTSGAPIDLYISRQTGQHSVFMGSKGKTTDQWEHGSVSISTSGPVQYSVIPSDFSIGPNQTKMWYGTVWGDVGSGPPPGQSVPASITGNYQVSFSRPSNATATGHEIVNQTGTETVNFMVHSLNVTTVDSVWTCPNTAKVLFATGYPAGGTYAWTGTGGVAVTAGANTDQPTIQCAAAGNGTAKVTYTVNGVSFSSTIQVVCANPTLQLTCGDTLRVAINQQFQIGARILPRNVGGTIKWTVSNGLTLNSGPYNIIAFITPNAGGWQTATATATVCGQTITKTVQIYVNPCLLSAPDSVVILQNVSATVSAYCNVNGTYAWTSGGGVQIEGAANQASVTIKGTTGGSDGWAQAAFSNPTCNQTKRVKVVVLEKPTLKIYASFGRLSPICKGERIIMVGNGQPSGGTYAWSINGTSIGWMGNTAPGNTANPVFEALGGGTSSLNCTYTVQGQTATASVSVTVNEYSKVVVTANPAGDDVNNGATVMYTAVAYDPTGAVANPQPSFHWKVVYIPIGQDANAGNWVSYDLNGSRGTQNYTWTFPQGNFPLPAGGPPFKMRAWIEAAEYCTYRSGSVHINVVRKP